jgi:L-iditol 2-dehydrogenase
VILACAQAAPDRSVISLLAPGGKLSVFSGLPPSVSDTPLDMTYIHYKELTIAGAYGCTAQNNRDAVDILSETPAPVQRIITKRILPEDIVGALSSDVSRKPFKTIAEFCHESSVCKSVK